MIYRELYSWGTDQLNHAGIEEAELDARLLLEAVCGTGRSDLIVHGDRQVSQEWQDRYQSYIADRQAHIPLQHILGVQEFMGKEFLVNEHVLIPRQDTEILVEEVLRHLHDGMSILDMCTGSGCILLSLLAYTNRCNGTGVDLSDKALEVARANAKRLQLEADYIQSDLFEKVEGKFDLIVSNPPYIATEVIRDLMPEVREHEPMMALDGKEDGLYFYRKIITQAAIHLHRGGGLFFEIGYDQGPAVRDLMLEAGYKEVDIVKDFAGLDRVVLGFLF